MNFWDFVLGFRKLQNKDLEYGHTGKISQIDTLFLTSNCQSDSKLSKKFWNFWFLKLSGANAPYLNFRWYFTGTRTFVFKKNLIRFYLSKLGWIISTHLSFPQRCNKSMHLKVIFSKKKIKTLRIRKNWKFQKTWIQNIGRV